MASKAASNLTQTPPKKPNLIDARTAIQATIENQRATHAINVKDHILECGISSWFETCLSNPDDKRWNEKLSLQVKEQLLKKSPKVLAADGWVALTKAFREKSKSEDTVYGSMKDIFAKIREAAQGVDTTLGEGFALYSSTPTQPTVNDVHGPKLKPDGRFVLMPQPERPTAVLRRSARLADKMKIQAQVSVEGNVSMSTSDTAALFEYKLGSTDKWQNYRQILGGAAFVLYNDPRRVGVYGVTIEKTTVRLWHFDRGAVLISPAFDCQKEPEHLIRICLYLSYASRLQLGYDSTVNRVTTNDNLDGKELGHGFVYQVGNKHYRTVGQPIYEAGAFWTISRGVRLWVVKECDKDGVMNQDSDEMVLKDLWLYEDSLGEADIQAEILHRLPKERVEEMKRTFVTILEEVTIQGEGQKTLAKPPDAVQFAFVSNPSIFAKDPQTGSLKRAGGTQPGVFDGRLKGIRPPEPLQHHQRTHRRILFKERCRSFCEVPSPKVAWEVGWDFVNGLDLFRQAGFIHRNISGDTCLFYYDSKAQKYQGKLFNLEYCKRYQEIGFHDPKSIPREFAALEVLGTDWRIRGPMEPPPFHRHYYHDLESFFWLLIWYITRYLPIMGNGDDSEIQKILVNLDPITWEESISDELFPVEFNTRAGARADFWANEEYYMRRMERDVGWPSKTVQELRKIPSTMLAKFKEAYAALHKNPRKGSGERWPDESFEESLYKEFKKVLDDVAQTLGTLDSISMRDLIKLETNEQDSDSEEMGEMNMNMKRVLEENLDDDSGRLSKKR